MYVKKKKKNAGQRYPMVYKQNGVTLAGHYYVY